MPNITSQTLKATPVGTEEIPVNDAGLDRKITVAGIRQPATDHIGNESNPHNVTKSQVGLGNVDNTSDANKPLSNAAIAANALLAPKGLLSASGLTIPTARLAGRSSAGTGALEDISIGRGLALAGGILSAPLPGERLISANVSTTDTDYLVTLQGTINRTLTLKADSPNGTQILARNDATSPDNILTVTAPVGGNVILPYRTAALFQKSSLGWLQIAFAPYDSILVTSEGSGSGVLTPHLSSGLFTLATSGYELILSAPASLTGKTRTVQNHPTSLFILTVEGHINGVDNTPIDVYPGETLVMVSTGTTWQILSGPQVSRHRSVVPPTTIVNANATANTLADIAELGFNVIPGTYRFRFVIRYDAAATTTGARFTVNGPTTSALTYRSLYTLTATTETLNHGLTAFNQPAAANATSLTNGNIAIIEGIATFTASGTLLPRFASEVSSSAITVLPGSTGELIRL
jgi:hypothetical protein